METIEDLEKVSIYQLRNIARRIGVFRPTTLTKAKLISEMTDIMTGKKPPYKPAVRQGRPPKTLTPVDSVVRIIPVDKEMDAQTIDESNILSTKIVLEQPAYTFGASVTERKHITGYVEILVSGIAFVRSASVERTGDKYVINTEMVERYNLKNGDHIDCEVEKVADGQPFLVAEIHTINNLSLIEYSRIRVDFDQLPVAPMTQQLMFKPVDNSVINALYKMPIYCGSTTAIVSKTTRSLGKALADVADNVQSVFGGKVIYLNVSKNRFSPILNNADIIQFTASAEDSFREQQRTAFLAMNYAKVCAGLGEKVILVADNLDSLATCVMMDELDLPVVKKLMSTAKNTSFGSITIITGFLMPDDTMMGKAIANLYYNNVDILLQLDDEEKVDFNRCRYSLYDFIPPKEADEIRKNLK